MSIFIAPAYVLKLISYDHKNYDLSSLQVIITGGSPLPKGIAQKLRQKLPNIKFFVQCMVFSL